MFNKIYQWNHLIFELSVFFSFLKILYSSLSCNSYYQFSVRTIITKKRASPHAAASRSCHCLTSRDTKDTPAPLGTPQPTVLWGPAERRKSHCEGYLNSQALALQGGISLCVQELVIERGTRVNPCQIWEEAKDLRAFFTENFDNTFKILTHMRLFRLYISSSFCKVSFSREFVHCI